MPTTIGIQEFESQAARIIQAIKENMGEYIITDQGQPVAVLRPVTTEEQTRWQKEEVEAELAEMQALAQQVGKAWESPDTGVSLINEQRR